MEGPARVEILRSLEELEGIRDIWTRWQKHPNCDLDFYCRVVSSTPTMLRPHVMVVYRGERAEAMLVGRIDAGSVDLSVGYKKILGIRARTLTFLHGGLVGNKSAANCRELVRSIQSSLAGGEANLAYFNHLRTDEPMYDELDRLTGHSGRRSFATLRNHRGMSLASSGEGFLRTLTSKERNNQKRRSKRMQEDFAGQIQIRCFRAPADLEKMIPDIDEIAKKTYQRALGVGFEDTPELRKRLQMEAERGWLRAYVLYLQERPCAFWMGNVYADTFYSGFTGYDPANANSAPGLYRLRREIERLCNENGEGILRGADFGLGDAEWKLIIGDQEWQEAPVFIFAPTAKGGLLRLVRRGTELLDLVGQKVLKRAQLLARVKKIWRGRLSEKQH